VAISKLDLLSCCFTIKKLVSISLPTIQALANQQFVGRYDQSYLQNLSFELLGKVAQPLFFFVDNKAS
jgi:hypothetical protein